jgi:hypothetical protein
MSLARVLQDHQRMQAASPDVSSVGRHTAVRSVPDHALPSDVHEIRELNSRSPIESEGSQK